ncbi:MAG: N-acetylmuramoyl-L-alanine amidase [Saprospirales bacterium]|nr:N-acetylmuramoyl-L-alanine amidase [Saprospirales bacterium]
MKIENHILVGAQFKQTPNISGLKINGPKFLILHYTASGNTEGTLSWLTYAESGVSAHILIGRGGEVWQLASFDQIARHCGKSEWEGLESLNGYSIGIEFVNWGVLTAKQRTGSSSSPGTAILSRPERSMRRNIRAAAG